MPAAQKTHFNDLPVVCDDDTWIWHFLAESLKDIEDLNIKKVPSNISFRQSWERFKQSDRIIVHWECQHRPGGAIIEELLEINPLFDVAQKVVVLTSAPLREDVVYLSELGVRRITRLRHKEADLQAASAELVRHLSEEFTRDPIEAAWQKVHRAIDFLTRSSPATHIEKIEKAIHRLQSHAKETNARYFDAMASVQMAKGALHKAEKLWEESLQSNPNYFRAQNNLVCFYQHTDQHPKALDILSRLHSYNKNKISRLVEFGDSYLAMKDDHKAEHFYQRALNRDGFCSGALNGLAEIRFRHGDLEEARQLLARTALAYQFASQLNRLGIELVRKQRYEDALMHYTKAQYVLPQKEKGPKLFYNIGLCYQRWGKSDMAIQFLKIAAVKEPSYKKAQALLEKILRSRPQSAA